MRKICIVLFGLVGLSILASAPLGAEDASATRGFYEGTKGSRMVVASPNGGKKDFEINEGTTLINPGRPGDISRLPRHSIVQVISRDGVAVEIVVVEVAR